ncbi:ABC transporter substrate-binding protein [Streptomyces sp. NPDC058221]|uniref:ABC transporter substrate-binding protein n=1 Tax=Streptomyces sp. NPDC058221 TaxID=3346388 RepID=UPI0036E7A237
MLDRFRNRALGPADKVIVLAVGVILLAAAAFAVVRMLPEKCGDGFEEAAKECVGVTAGVLDGDPELDGLIRAVAKENARVEKGWKDPENGEARIPYVRVALMMPFDTDAASAMSTAQIARALAGAYVAQLRANAQAGPRYQLLLANDGKDLDHWQPVVDRLAPMVADKEAPLVGVFGMPNSTPDTLAAAEALSKQRIPTVGPIITSTTMEAGYLFKTSPSNDLLAQALGAYLEKHPGGGTGFLVFDRREKDSYSTDLRDVFLKHFGKKYGLKQRQASYLGLIGDDKGVPQRFADVARSICLTKADTVFFAGRDHDLPHLVNQLASEASCSESPPTRILKVGIGMDPESTGTEITTHLRDSRITLVGAASVDTLSWKNAAQLPAGPRGFMEYFEKLRKAMPADAPAWGAKPLDDGYAVMYHDAFTMLAQATDRAYDDLNGEGGDAKGEDRQSKPGAGDLPSHDDVYNTVVNMNILGTDAGAKCVNCVHGASGTFGFDDSPDTRKWAVCKPVPVIEYPAAPAAGKGRKADRVFRSYEDNFGGSCP